MELHEAELASANTLHDTVSYFYSVLFVNGTTFISH